MSPLKDGYTLVFLESGAKVSHVLPPNSSPNEYSRALCRREPTWPSLWAGTGSQGEYEKARILPLCIGCAAHIRKHGT